jgi:hypothetical protein
MINSPQEENSIRNRLLRQARWRTQTQGTSLVMTAVVLVAVIGALYLAQASRTAAAGRRLQQAEADRQQLEQENAQLRAEIAALRSVPRLIAQAQALGYHPARSNEVDYVTVRGVAPPEPEPVEERVVYETPPDAEEEAINTYDETLESYLSLKLEGFREQLAIFFEATFGSLATPEPAPDGTPGPTRVP